MAAIPTVILEEHQEAYLAVARALSQGQIHMAEHQLLHIDEHHDLAPPVVVASSFSLSNNLETLTALTYQQLRVSDFIIPLAYQGLIKEIHWIRRSHQANASLNLTLRTVSYGDRVVFRSAATRADGQLKVNRICTEDGFTPCRPVLLSIDLDYFSCDDHQAEYSEIEITAEAYQSFLVNKLHPWRCKFGSRVNVMERTGRYYLVHRTYDGPLEDRRASDEEVTGQVRQLREFLTRNAVSPELILICRSMLTGYTPPNQALVIEGEVLQMLTSLYNLGITHIG